MGVVRIAMIFSSLLFDESRCWVCMYLELDWGGDGTAVVLKLYSYQTMHSRF